MPSEAPVIRSCARLCLDIGTELQDWFQQDQILLHSMVQGFAQKAKSTNPVGFEPCPMTLTSFAPALAGKPCVSGAVRSKTYTSGSTALDHYLHPHWAETLRHICTLSTCAAASLPAEPREMPDTLIGVKIEHKHRLDISHYRGLQANLVPRHCIYCQLSYGILNNPLLPMCRCQAASHLSSFD